MLFYIYYLKFSLSKPGFSNEVKLSQTRHRLPDFLSLPNSTQRPGLTVTAQLNTLSRTYCHCRTRHAVPDLLSLPNSTHCPGLTVTAELDTPSRTYCHCQTRHTVPDLLSLPNSTQPSPFFTSTVQTAVFPPPFFTVNANTAFICGGRGNSAQHNQT